MEMLDGLEVAADITRIKAICFTCHSKVLCALNNSKQTYNNNNKNEIDISVKNNHIFVIRREVLTFVNGYRDCKFISYLWKCMLCNDYNIVN